MRFGEGKGETPKESQKEFKSPENCWNKISDLILNKKGDFLRKSLRVLNKEKYDKYEEMSKTMRKLKPKRSFCRNQSYYRIQSIKNNEIAQTRRSGIIASGRLSPVARGSIFHHQSPVSSTKSILGIPKIDYSHD